MATNRKSWVKYGDKMDITRDIRCTGFYEQERLSHKDLIDLVAEYSNYHKYEVEDILHYVAVGIAEILQSGRGVHFRGLGYFMPMKRKPYKFKNAFFNGKKTLTNPKQSMSVRPDYYMKNSLNDPELLLQRLSEKDIISTTENNEGEEDAN